MSASGGVTSNCNGAGIVPFSGAICTKRQLLHNAVDGLAANFDERSAIALTRRRRPGERFLQVTAWNEHGRGPVLALALSTRHSGSIPVA